MLTREKARRRAGVRTSRGGWLIRSSLASWRCRGVRLKARGKQKITIGATPTHLNNANRSRQFLAAHPEKACPESSSEKRQQREKPHPCLAPPTAAFVLDFKAPQEEPPCAHDEAQRASARRSDESDTDALAEGEEK